VGVVDGGKHRIGKAAAMDDAADAEAVVLVGVARLASLEAAAALRGNRSRLRRARRKMAIRWIDHQRGAPRRRVVFAPMRDRSVGALHFSGEHVNPREIALVARSDVLESLGVFRVGEELTRAVLRR